MRAAAKLIMILTGLLLITLAVAIILLSAPLEKLARVEVERRLTNTFQTNVSIASLRVVPHEGALELVDSAIHNPNGFESGEMLHCARLLLFPDVTTLLGATPRLREVRADGVLLNLRHELKAGTNIRQVLKAARDKAGEKGVVTEVAKPVPEEAETTTPVLLEPLEPESAKPKDKADPNFMALLEPLEQEASQKSLDPKTASLPEATGAETADPLESLKAKFASLRRAVEPGEASPPRPGRRVVVDTFVCSGIRLTLSSSLIPLGSPSLDIPAFTEEFSEDDSAVHPRVAYLLLRTLLAKTISVEGLIQPLAERLAEELASL